LNAALYATIWTSLVLFAAGETGRLLARPASWAWPASTAGLLLCVIHVLIALAHTHGWSHDAAIAATAAQTRAVFGLDWGGGIYVNYGFVAAWTIDAWTWRAPRPHQAPRRVWRWVVRAFYAIVVFNAAVVFAAGVRRALGVAIVVWLAWIWTRSRGRA
jgi:hypothetical protein